MQAVLSAFEPAARIVVATLFNSLWEAAILAVLVAAALRLLPNVSATTRYAAWCVALFASLLLPLATALPQIEAPIPAHHSSARVIIPSALPKTVQRPRQAVQQPRAAAQSTSSVSAPASAPALRLPGRIHFALPQWVALALFGAWLVAAVLLLVRLLVNLLRLERLKSDALPLPVEYRERLQRWASADKGEREVRLCTCESIEVPVAVGLFDSMILIPKHLLDTLTQSEIDQIILHELAHLRRADDWTNGVQRFIQALFFFNPAVLYIAQQLDLEREVACDDWVVDQTKEVRPYATCLTKMAEATAWPHRPLAAPGVFVTRRGLSVRVERLLRAGRNVRTSVAFGPTGAIVAGLIVLFFVLQTVAPSFAFTMPEQYATTAGAHTTAAREAKTLPHEVKPSPGPTTKVVDVNVPAQHIHTPARHFEVNVPAVNVDVPAQHIHMVLPSVAPVQPLAPDFARRMANVSKTVNQAVAQSMAQAFSGKGRYNCVGCDYSGQNLSGRSFRGQQLNGADFSRANLRNADFSYSVLVGADFSRADLSGANFSHAKLTGCDLSRARLDGVDFGSVTMVGCDVDARNLTPSQSAALLRGCSTGCDFSYADLSNQDLRGIRLTGIDLSHANLSGANLSGAQLQGVDFSDARLDGVRLSGADITGCDFSGVDLHSVDFSNARVAGSKMGAANR